MKTVKKKSMADVVQKLPSLSIPGPFSHQQKLASSNVKDKNLEYFYSLKHRLPPVSSSKPKRSTRNQPNYWAYGTSYLVTLLFNGQLPKSFLDELCEDGQKSEPKSNKTHTLPLRERNIELWAPKDYQRIRSSGIRIEQKILEARWRQREKLEAISSRISSSNAKGNEILLKKEATMERGKIAYLVKLERNYVKKPESRHHRTCPSPIGGSVQEDIFKLTEVSGDEGQINMQELAANENTGQE